MSSIIEELILLATMKNNCSYCGKEIEWKLGDCYADLFKGFICFECPYCKNRHSVKINLEKLPFEINTLGDYKARNGKKAHVYKIYGDRIDFTIDGGKRKYIGHNKNGNFFDNGARNPHDIISKWED